METDYITASDIKLWQNKNKNKNKNVYITLINSHQRDYLLRFTKLT